MITTLVPNPVAGQPTPTELLARLWTAVAVWIVDLLRSFGLLPPEQHGGRHWLREAFGVDEQTATELHAIGVQMGEDREFGRPHGVLIDDTQPFTPVDYADAWPGYVALDALDTQRQQPVSDNWGAI